MENVSPCDDGDSSDDAVVTEVLRRWETLFEGTVGALDEAVTTATAYKRNRANDVLRAAFELAVKKSSRGDGKMDEKSRRRRRLERT